MQQDGRVHFQMPLSDYLNPHIEDLIRKEINDFYLNTTPDSVAYADIFMDFQGYQGLPDYLFSSIDTKFLESNNNLHCSGFSVGSEMLVTKQYHFGEIHGVEVDDSLIQTGQKRLAYLENMFPILYDGNYLPYPDNYFGVIVSGHVIEHVNDPQLYINECNLVLDTGGVISLEFPDCYHWKELHTGLLSFEWLLQLMRDNIYRLLSSSYSPLPNKSKLKYRSFVDTRLCQISLRGVANMLRISGVHYRIINPVDHPVCHSEVGVMAYNYV